MRFRLWERRSEQGITIRELEQLSGIPRSTINDLENGKTIPNLLQLEAFARALGIGIVDLFDSNYKYRRPVRDFGQIINTKDK